MALPTKELEIDNMSLGRIGAKRITQAQLDASPITNINAQHCDLHYEQSRDALQRSHWWRFARARSELTQDTDFEGFEWDNQFSLPDDYLRFRSIFEETDSTSRSRRHALEGDKLLTNLDEVSLLYIKQVTDVALFDPLYTEVLVLQLALKLVPPISGVGSAGQTLLSELKNELKPLMAQVRAVDSNETDVGGRSDWNLARHGGLGIMSGEERFL